MSLPVALLALSDEDRAELERLARSEDRRLEERARIVLACAVSADGNSGQPLSWGSPSRRCEVALAVHRGRDGRPR